MNGRLRINAGWNPVRNGVELAVYSGAPGGATQVMTLAEFTTGERGEYIPPEVLVLDREAAGELMEQLWAAGIRPQQAKDSTELVAALRDHLDDARTLRDRYLPEGRGD